MLIFGEHELNSARMEDMGEFFAALGSSHKRFLVLPGGGHAILLRRPHARWQREVLRFFEEGWN